MSYVIRRTDQGRGYLGQPGSHNTYTNNVLNARRFDTREDAEAELCVENEVVVDYHDLVMGRA